MTPAQRIRLQSQWWPEAAAAQGWQASDRALRLRVCAWAVSLGNPSKAELIEAIASERSPARALESTNDLNNAEDIDRVKNCLGMLADKLRETGEVGRPEMGQARRLRDVIRADLKCLALYEPSPRAYLASIIHDLFNAWRQYGSPLTIQDLTAEPITTKAGKRIPSQLDQLVMRLAAVVNKKRNENQLVPAYAHLQGSAPFTIHEMKLTAGVFCVCAVCKKIRARGHQPFVPPLPEDWSDFEPELEGALDEFGGNTGDGVEQPF